MSVVALHSQGRLPENITYFCKALRRAGVPVGTAQILDTIRAVNAVGFTKRHDFRRHITGLLGYQTRNISRFLIKCSECFGAIQNFSTK